MAGSFRQGLHRIIGYSTHSNNRFYSSRRLQDRVAIITGASSGLGRAIALRYASEGAKVVCSDLRPDAIEDEVSTHTLISQNGGRSKFVETDVGSEESVQTLIDLSTQEFGKVDIMVNNAGIAAEAENPTPIYETSADTFHSTIRVNSFGVFLGCKYAGMQMMKQEPYANGDRGWIINIASVLGLVGKSGTICYSSAKGSVVNMTRTAALDYAPLGIHVNAIAPGFTDTPMISSMAANADVKAQIDAVHPLKGLGKPGDFEGPAVFLASDDASWITGAILPVEGGYLAQ
ncbi:NAD(P)-binding protein [Microthyrium microscopicum]|uniref:NAD(P)-binding protein n=1 Tax=Microthyrium microscopicum TaxID=703497 RepID=A0A6A6UHT1_9PEZI|nr:NAD(P)-binding protein [Microthyrium microscopicum]